MHLYDITLLTISRNSGIAGGKFLERRQVMKPKSNQPYLGPDFTIGATIEIFANKFTIQSADEYALGYMEANAEEYPQSDVFAIIKKMQEMMPNEEAIKRGFIKFDKDSSGTLSVMEFREAALSLGVQLSEQEVLTIVRRYDLDGDGVVSYPEFVRALKN
jgi:EF-hand domain-containing protein 1